MLLIYNIRTFATMKKGAKLKDTQYFLEIKDLEYKPIFLASVHSLREAVSIASKHVTNMDHYAKVLRELKALNGAFIGMYFAPAEGTEALRHAFVLIRAESFPPPKEIAKILDKAERIEALIESGKIRIPKSG